MTVFKNPRLRNHNQTAQYWIAIIGYSMICLGPLIALAHTTIRFLMFEQVEGLHLLLPNERRLGLLLNSIGLGVGASIIAMIVGWIGAVMIWTWSSKRWSQVLIWVTLLLAALPSYIYALAWLSSVTYARKLLGNGATRLLHGWGGGLWVEIAAFTPLALCFAWIGLRNIDPDLIESGRLSQTDFSSLLRIALPLSVPATLTGGGIIFLFSILDYGVPSLFQLDVYSMEIFTEYSASNSPERAFLLAIPLLLIAVIVVIALLKPLREVTAHQVQHHHAWNNPPHWPIWAASLGWVIGSILLIQVLLPLSTLLFMGGDPKLIIFNSIQARAETSYSLQVATLTALLSLPIASAIAHILLRNSNKKILWLLVLAPIAMPAALVGASVTHIFNHPLLHHEAFMEMMPILVNMARFMPLAVLIVLAQLRRTDRLLFDAAQIFQPSFFQRIMQIEIPLLAPGLLAAAGVVFAFSLGELGGTLMVVPPGKSTLTMRIYNYLHYGASDAVTGISLILAIIVLLSGGLVIMASRLLSRLFSPPEVKP